MVLKAVGDCAGMSAVIDLKAVSNPVAVKNFMRLARIHSQTILVGHIHRDGAILPKITDVLVDEGKGRIGRSFREQIRLRNAILGWTRPRLVRLGIVR